MGASGFHHQLLAPSFFRFFWLVLGCHCQVLVEGEPPFFVLFCCFCDTITNSWHKGSSFYPFIVFVVFKTPLPRVGKEGACSPFFIFLVASTAPWPSYGKSEAWAPPLLPFFFFLLGASGRHHQVLAEGLGRWVGFFFGNFLFVIPLLLMGFKLLLHLPFPCEKVGGAFFIYLNV